MLLLEIPNFSKSGNKNGIGSPATTKTLSQSMGNSKKLAVVQPSNLASDAQNVLERLIEPLGNDKVLRLDDPDKVWDACNVDYHGNSNCHAVLTFTDSPGSGAPNATWNYTIQVDSSRQGSSAFNVFDHDNVYENFWIPLQVAIDNAIANSTTLPDVYSYAYGNQEEREKQAREGFLMAALYILSFVFFLSMATVVHHVATMMTTERESGLSQLVDAMAGGVSWARVLSYVLFFDLLYLPLWIIIGSCKSSPRAPSEPLYHNDTNSDSALVFTSSDYKSCYYNSLADPDWLGYNELRRVWSSFLPEVCSWCHSSLRSSFHLSSYQFCC